MGDFMRKIQSRRIDSKYSIVQKIGEGGHGSVYRGRNRDTDTEVALKLEHRDIAPSILEEEREIYTALEGLPGFPRVYWYGWEDDYKILAFQLLGPSLEDVFAYCGSRFSLKTVLMIADQLFFRLEAMHSRGIVHRDIKPQNCLLGTGRDGNVLYMTDFGLSQEYSADVRETGPSASTHSRLVGTPRFASIRGHTGHAQSPRDDLESFSYMLIYFFIGKLPWQGLKARDQDAKAALVLKMKEQISTTDLCRGLPKEFTKLMDETRSLRAGEMPDYRLIRKMFRRLAEREDINYDDVYDWTILKYFKDRARGLD